MLHIFNLNAIRMKKGHILLLKQALHMKDSSMILMVPLKEECFDESSLDNRSQIDGCPLAGRPVWPCPSASGPPETGQQFAPSMLLDLKLTGDSGDSNPTDLPLERRMFLLDSFQRNQTIFLLIH